MASGLSGAVRYRASAGRFSPPMQPPAMEDVQHAIGDRYELLSAVGAGGMGFVYSARHVTLGHVVAVKVLPPEVAASEMRLRRFQQEAALAASLAHPHIVPVYDFGVRAGITFLIMPFVRGRTLEGMLARELRGARPELAPPVAAALVAPLAPRPDERPRTVAAWLAAVDRARARPWGRWAATGVAAVAVLAGGGWSLCRTHVLGICRPATVTTVAVMPFDKLGGESLPDRQLMEVFARRLSAAPNVVVLSGARVYSEAVRRYGSGALSDPEADSLAQSFDARYFVQPSLV